MLNSQFGSFALPYGYDYSLTKFVKEVKTIKWAKLHTKHLVKYQDRLTRAVRDDRQIIGGMLHAAYGVNIGSQIEARLSDRDISKIRKNIIFKI